MSLSEPLCPRPYPPTRRASRPTPAPLLFVVDRALDPLHELRGEFHLIDLAGMGGRLLEDLLHRLPPPPHVTSCAPAPVSQPGAFISCGYFPGRLVGPVSAFAQALTFPAISTPQ